MTVRLASSDPIAAIATPAGRGGVCIVRVSGDGVGGWGPALIGRAFAPRVPMRVRFLDRDAKPIDDGLALFFEGPRSYTGEDVIELHGHGGPVVASMLLRRAVECGARLAQSGEFTRRAYLNGKLDLAQAEAVADLIDASTEAAARSAMRSLAGEFSALIRAFLDELVHLRMLVEAGLDFPEEEIDPVHREDTRTRLAGLRVRVDQAIARARQGALLRTGATLVLAGQPNVGKSSLLNRLAGDELAIVTPIAGTTRDSVRSEIQIAGVPIHVVDTAGLRDTDDPVERIGVERTWREIERADGVMLIVDARAGLTPQDEAIAARLPARLPRLVVENKADLVDATAADGALRVSALTGEGVERLEAAVLDLVGWQASGEDVFVARERHLAALDRARAALARAADRLDSAELFAEELRLAQDALAEITGEFTADDLLGEIFARFCIGK